MFDSNSFRELGSYYPDQFPSFWREFNQAVDVDNKIISVREVRRELEIYTRHAHITNWVEEHKSIFRKPSVDERNFVNQILSTKNFNICLDTNIFLRANRVLIPSLLLQLNLLTVVLSLKSQKSGMLQIYQMCVNILILNAQTYKDSWKEKAGNSKTPKKVSS